MLRNMGLIGGAVLLAAPSAAASASPPPELQKAFEGTIVSVYPDGRVAHVWLRPDGTYTQEGRRHDRYDASYR